MSLLIILTQNEINIIKDVFIKNAIDEEMEIYLIKFSKKEFEHSHCNLLRENIVLNFENPMIENYIKTLEKNESLLEDILKVILNELQVDAEIYAETIKGSNKLTELTETNNKFLEKYLFEVLDQGISNFQKKEFTIAYNEFILSKYIYETIIMLNVFNRNGTKNFFDIFEKLVDRSVKVKSADEDYTILSLLGGPIKEMKRNNVILSSDTTSAMLNSTSYSDEDKEREFISLIIFYPEIMKLIAECKKHL